MHDSKPSNVHRRRQAGLAGGALILAAGFVLATIALPAEAHGRRGGGRVGVYIGGPIVPFYGPRFYYPPPVYYAPPLSYYDYPPAVRVVPAPPVVYVERGDALEPAPPVAQAAQPQAPEWFYCTDSATYYPYVRECASPWQRVPAQPPAQPPSVPR